MFRLLWIRPSGLKHCKSKYVTIERLERVLTQSGSGTYFLSELHHGLDVINLETTATLKPDGSFDLHTPHKGAAKSVPQSHTVWRISSFPKTGSCLLPFPLEPQRTPSSSPVCSSTGRIEE